MCPALISGVSFELGSGGMRSGMGHSLYSIRPDRSISESACGYPTLAEGSLLLIPALFLTKGEEGKDVVVKLGVGQAVCHTSIVPQSVIWYY